MRSSLSAQRREIMALSLPAMLALAADPLLSLIDTALVGRLGPTTLAALGIDAVLFATVAWLCNFLTYGTTTEIARLYGTGVHARTGSRVVQALWLALALGLALTALLLLAGPLLLGAMGAHDGVYQPALIYLRIRALAAVPGLVVLVGHGAFRGLKDTRTPLRVALWLNGSDALLSWILIYPLGLGIAGAAWGTVAAQTGAALYFLVLLNRRLTPDSVAPNLQQMRAIMRVSRDLLLRTSALVVGIVLSTAAAARMGAASLGAHQIARELWVFMTLALDGFAIAGQAMIATSLGRDDLANARREIGALLRIGVVTGLLLGAVFLAVIDLLPALFTADAAVRAQVREVWWIVAVLQPLGAVVFVLDGVFLGAHDYRILKWTAVVGALGVLVPGSYVALWQGWGLKGIWAGMVGFILVRLVSLVARLHGFRDRAESTA